MNQIVVNPEILGGKPIIEGTRLSVEQVLGLLASGMSHAEICDAYPELNEEKLRLAVAYASRALSNDVIINLQITHDKV